jgi:hypothetical protein
MKYDRLCSQFDKKRALVAATQKALARINSYIIASVAKEYHSQLISCKTPRQKLVQLAILFKPKGSTRHQDLRNEWRRMISHPIGRTSLETWLTNWANLYDEAKAANVPDVCYTAEGYPPDAAPIRDLLQAIQPQDSYFANNWRKDLDQKQPMTFHGVISAYRDHRKVQDQAKKGSSSPVALAATLNGEKTDSPRCVCGSTKHQPRDCYSINPAKRPVNWKESEARRQTVEKNIKKLSAAEQEEIASLRQNETKTAQLALTKSTGADNPVQIDSIAFFSSVTPTVSPAVHKAALTYDLRRSWIVDSGANVHVCNQKDWFTNMTNEARSIAQGSGDTLTIGQGAIRIMINDPRTQRPLWVTIDDVWYAPSFQTNLLSVSQLKKKRFFFNSEIPAIVQDSRPIIQCVEQYGLYLLPSTASQSLSQLAFASTGSSYKPLVSVATPQTWHRRLAHLYDHRVETLAKMVDGMEIKGQTKDNASENPERCEVCHRTRANRQISRRPAGRSRIYGKSGRIHFDMVQIDEAYNGHKWLSHLYIEGIRLHMAQSHEKKNGCVDAIIGFTAICRNQFGMDIRVFKSDQERSLGYDIQQYCAEEGIICEFSVVGTPEQNSFAERAGGVIISTARALILDSGLPKDLWPEAVNTAVYLINRMPTTLPNGQVIIPWLEAMTNKEGTQDVRLNLANLRVYGCRAYVRRQGIPRMDKMASRADIGFLVGYVASNIWKVWFPQLDTVRQVRDVIFDENVRFTAKDLLKEQPTQDVLDRLPWSIGEDDEDQREQVLDVRTDTATFKRSTGQKQSSTSETKTTHQTQEEPIRTEKHQGEPFGAERSQKEPARDPAMVTPSPTPSRHVSAVPGAFPSPSSLGRPEPEGVSGSTHALPDQQLQTDLEASAQPNDDSDDPPEGYRRFGEIAPHDITASLSQDNIIEGKRTRKKAYFAGTAAVQRDPEDYHEGILLAFAVGINPPQVYQRPHRDDLPPEPANWNELMKHLHRDAFVEAAKVEIEALGKKGTYQEVNRPTDRSIQVLPLTWVFTYKFDSNGILVKHKARICVRGDLQKVSADEKYSATLAVRTARAMLALTAAFDLDTAQYDAVNAFLNSLLDEDVYVELPPGLFKDRRTRCWKLLRALYGLRKSPRLWQQEATRVLISIGFRVVQEDHCLFVREGIILIFYVDDILIFNHPTMRTEAADIAKRLSEAWELRSIGEAQWFLGIRIIRDRQQGVIWLCQDAYISSMATRYHLTNERRLEAPPASIANLGPYTGKATEEQVREFSTKVGSAQYATTITRVDAAKATSHLAQFLSNPSREHLHAINQVISYLYNTRTRAIAYRRPTEIEFERQILQFFSDASYGDHHDRKSSEGFICMLFGGPIEWRAAKQKTVTTSTTEAELLALSEAARSVCMWTRLFRTIMFDPGHSITLQCDNKQTLSLLTKESPQLRTKLRHVDIHQHWLRQEVQSGRIAVEWTKTANMVADGLTKLLPRQKHAEFVRLLGMEDIGYLLEGVVCS